MRCLFTTALSSPYFIYGIVVMVCEWRENVSNASTSTGCLCRTAKPKYVVIILFHILVCLRCVNVCDILRLGEATICNRHTQNSSTFAELNKCALKGCPNAIRFECCASISTIAIAADHVDFFFKCTLILQRLNWRKGDYHKKKSVFIQQLDDRCVIHKCKIKCLIYELINKFCIYFLGFFILFAL